MKHKAVFLDKDGNLLPNITAPSASRKVDLNGRFIEGLQLLQSYGYLLVVVSNEAPEQVEAVKNTISALCKKMGIYLDGFYYCPHHSSWSNSAKDCDCMKPAPGLLLKAAGDMDIDLSESWMIGDLISDVETAKNAGCNTVLVKNNKKQLSDDSKTDAYQAKDLADAARKILYATGAMGKKKRQRKAEEMRA